jgi:hypothetical protein
MTVQLTPLSAESEGLAVVEKNTEQIVVKELRKGKGNYEFDYIIHAVRKGYEKYDVIRDKPSELPSKSIKSDSAIPIESEYTDTDKAGGINHTGGIELIIPPSINANQN